MTAQLIHHYRLDMTKLRLVPVPCACDDHNMNFLRVALGMTHKKSARCPFLSDEFQHEVQGGTCCSWDLGELEAALEDLEKVPELDLYWLHCIDIRSHRTAEQGWSLAENLRRTQEELAGLRRAIEINALFLHLLRCSSTRHENAVG